MARTTVGVLRGGTSAEYDLSLKSGAHILNSLSEDDFDTRDIFIDKGGMWHSRGIPVTPLRALTQLDVVLNALHGGVGEDGTVQRILEQSGVPYVGSRPIQSALSLDKTRAAEVLRHSGVRMPRSLPFTVSEERDTGDMAREVFAQFGPPYMVKPARGGASHGIVIVATIVHLPNALADALDTFGAALVEEFIRGDEATVGVIEDFRGEDLYALPPVRVMLPQGAPFLQYEHHMGSLHQHMVPSDFEDDHKAELVALAKHAHRALGLSHYSRADFIVTKQGPYLLEVDSLPHLHEHAAFPKMLESVGSSMPQFLGHVIALARK